MAQDNVFILDYPVTFKNGKVMEQLTFRRAKIKDLKDIADTEKISPEEQIRLLSRVTGEAPAVIEELDADDFLSAMAFAKDFFPKSRETGDKSSDNSPTE